MMPYHVFFQYPFIDVIKGNHSFPAGYTAELATFADLERPLKDLESLTAGSLSLVALFTFWSVRKVISKGPIDRAVLAAITPGPATTVNCWSFVYNRKIGKTENLIVDKSDKTFPGRHTNDGFVIYNFLTFCSFIDVFLSRGFRKHRVWKDTKYHIVTF